MSSGSAAIPLLKAAPEADQVADRHRGDRAQRPRRLGELAAHEDAPVDDVAVQTALLGDLQPGRPVPGDLAELQQAEEEIALAESDDDGSSAEVFAEGPAGPVKLEVELDGQEYTFDDWDPQTKLLDFLESKGVQAPYSCREGECSACAIRLLAGDVRMLHNDVLDDEDIADDIRLGCQSLPTTDTVKVTYS